MPVMCTLAIVIAISFTPGCAGVSAPTGSQESISAAAGGTISANGATFVIPPGALAQDTVITLAVSSPSAATTASTTIRGQLFDFGPDGTTFRIPATLTLPISGTPSSAERAVISWLDADRNQWNDTPSTVTGDRVTAPITHFTVYAVRFVAPPRLDAIVRWWSFYQLRVGALAEERLGPDMDNPFSPLRMQIGGVVRESHDFGPLVVFPAGQDALATSEVFSSDTGKTYWVSTESPRANATQLDVFGSGAELVQSQWFRKLEPGATLRLVVTATTLETIDSGGDPTKQECPWLTLQEGLFACKRMHSATASFDVRAFWFEGQKDVLHTGGFAELNGWKGVWYMGDVYPAADATAPFWSPTSFNLERDLDLDGGKHGRMRLRAPITIDVPLSEVKVGDRFEVFVIAKVHATNRRNRIIDGVDSYVSAFFRDPAVDDGLGFDFTGLEPVEPAGVAPHDSPAAPAPSCTTGADAAAGTLHFSAATYAEGETPGPGATIVVTRSGGSRGAASVLLSTRDGTAVAGKDYTAVTTQVLFADGEEGSRAARIPILADALPAADRTVTLTLSAPGGCATLGTPSTAVLTILDDDRPPEVPEGHSVGGTVSGLVGSGLVLRNAGLELAIPAGSGDFTLPGQYPSGFAYAVSVVTQPSSPVQICSVAGGSGTVGDGDVTGVTVTCVTPDARSGLDPTFGSDGKVTTGLPRGAIDMALTADGKIVLLGDRTLARYDAAGHLDLGFGTGGTAPIAFITGSAGEAQGVTLQPDGKVLVVGYAREGSRDVFALARTDANGIVDGDFGSGGKVTTDFSGNGSRAWAALVQPDGAIVVVGHAAMPSTLGVGNDFAVARFTGGGVLDGGFGNGGKVTTDIGGRTDLAYAAVLQPDGKIVVSGRVADKGGDDPDVALVRYDGLGALDGSFGDRGIARSDLTAGRWDEASDLALAPDGKLVVAVRAAIFPAFGFVVARFREDGSLDGGFGQGGLASVAFSTMDDYPAGVALQGDGKIVVVGQSSNLMSPDLAVARLTAAGAPDESFGEGGKLAVDFFGSFDGGECVAIQPDGKIVVAGFARNVTTTGLGMVRLLP
jgi:uncharacterized delta-60 repeat protein